MARVFVVQNSGLYDLTPAERHGDLVYLAGPVLNIAADSARLAALEKFRELLSDYNYEKGDAVLCIGSPILIGYAVALAADCSDLGRVRCLQWDRFSREYVAIEANLFLS